MENHTSGNESWQTLWRVQAFIDEADRALHEQSERIQGPSERKRFLLFFITASAVILVDFVLLGLSGAFGILYPDDAIQTVLPVKSCLAAVGSLIGGGISAGTILLLVPFVPAVIVYAIVSKRIERKQLHVAKELLCSTAMAKQESILKVLRTEEEDKDRIGYLSSLNTILQRTTEELGCAG